MKLNQKMFDAMRDAARLLKTDGPQAATSAIQRSLGGLTPADGTEANRPLRDINPPPAPRAGKSSLAGDFVPGLLEGLRMPSPLGDMKFDLPGWKPQPDQGP
jgi:hypothetical protein